MLECLGGFSDSAGHLHDSTGEEERLTGGLHGRSREAAGEPGQGLPGETGVVTGGRGGEWWQGW